MIVNNRGTFERKQTMKINENQKVTLTLGQLKRLVKESSTAGEAKIIYDGYHDPETWEYIFAIYGDDEKVPYIFAANSEEELVNFMTGDDWSFDDDNQCREFVDWLCSFEHGEKRDQDDFYHDYVIGYIIRL